MEPTSMKWAASWIILEFICQPALYAQTPSATPLTPQPAVLNAPDPFAVGQVAPAPKYTWTLGAVKAIAFENNPDLKSARANYEAASAGVGVSVSTYLPHVDIIAKYDETTLPSPSGGSTAQLGMALPYKMVVAELNQTIFDFGKGLSRISASRASSRASEQDAFAIRNIVALAVERAFYDVQSSEQLVKVALNALAQYRETLRRTQALVRTGARPEFDLTQAKVEEAKAKLVVINAQNTRDYSHIALLNIMGVEDQSPFLLIDEGMPPEFAGVTSRSLDVRHLINVAWSERPEMKRQGFSLDSARDTLSGEIRNYLPTVSLRAWGGEYLPDYPLSLNQAWGVAVVGSWNILNGLQTTFQVKQDAALVDAQEALVEKNKLAVMAEVTRGYQDLIRAERNFAVAEEALAAAQENLHLAKRRYDANVSTILELLIAEDSLLTSQAAAVTARFDHEIALATLRQTVNAPLK
jgi:outer membrane protein